MKEFCTINPYTYQKKKKERIKIFKNLRMTTKKKKGLRHCKNINKIIVDEQT